MDDLKLILQQQNKLIEMMMVKLSVSPGQPQENLTSDAIANSISEFHYDPENGITFEAWFKRYDDLFASDCKSWDEGSKIRLLLRKLGVAEHDKYCNFLLPKKPTDYSWTETIQCLTSIFGDRSSLFHTRYQCLQIVKDRNDDFVTYAGLINRECERFKLKELSDDQFKCLIFVCGLQSPDDSDVRTRILSKIEADPDISLRSVTEECQRLVNLKHDTKLIEKNLVSPLVNKVQQKSLSKANAKKPHQNQKPKSACWKCDIA